MSPALPIVSGPQVVAALRKADFEQVVAKRKNGGRAMSEPKDHVLAMKRFRDELLEYSDVTTVGVGLTFRTLRGGAQDQRRD